VRYRYFLLVIIIIFLFTGCTSGRNGDELIYTGTVEAKEVDVSAQVGGIIERISVEEGQTITKEDCISKIDTESLELQLKEAEAGLKAAQAGLEELNNGARSEDIRKAKANLENIKALLEGARKNYEYKLQNLGDIEQLYKSSAVSEKQLEEAKLAVDTAYANLQSLQKQYEAAGAQLDLLLNGPTGQKITMAEAEVESTKARIELLKYQISKGQIISPIGGVVQNLFFDRGEFIPAGGSIAAVIDMDDLWVKIYVPEKQLYRLTLGEQVELLTDFSKKEKVTGKVVFISSEAEFTPNNVESKENKEEMVFAVKVKIQDRSLSLKPGMVVDVKLDGDM